MAGRQSDVSAAVLEARTLAAAQCGSCLGTSCEFPARKPARSSAANCQTATRPLAHTHRHSRPPGGRSGPWLLMWPALRRWASASRGLQQAKMPSASS